MTSTIIEYTPLIINKNLITFRLVIKSFTWAQCDSILYATERQVAEGEKFLIRLNNYNGGGDMELPCHINIEEQNTTGYLNMEYEDTIDVFPARLNVGCSCDYLRDCGGVTVLFGIMAGNMPALKEYGVSSTGIHWYRNKYGQKTNKQNGIILSEELQQEKD